MTPIELDHNKGLNGAIAGELRAERSRQRITYDQLAERTGIGRRTLIRIINGERAINMATLEAICEAFAVPPSAVIAAAQRHLDTETTADVVAFPTVENQEWLAAKRPGYSVQDQLDGESGL